MAGFTAGQEVRVPCTVQDGPFSYEALVTIATEGRILSGFVRRDLIEEDATGQTYLTGKVVGVEGRTISVRLPGSFFTTATGVAFLPPDQVRELSA